MSAALVLTVLMLLSFFPPPTCESQTDSLLELGHATKIAETPKAHSQLTIVTYNIRWRSAAELQEIANWLKKKPQPLLIGLQEVDRNRKRTGNTNNARILADDLGLYYAWGAPPTMKGDAEEETGVELLSSYPLKDVSRLVLPHTGPGGRARVAVGATVKVNDAEIRVYSVHSETRIPVSQKMDQLQTVIEDANRFPKARTIVMGDFNTWELQAVENTRKLFTPAGFTTPFSDDETTFFRRVPLLEIKLKLDWIWLRGLTAERAEIDRSITVSDHFPLSLIVDLPK